MEAGPILTPTIKECKIGNETDQASFPSRKAGGIHLHVCFLFLLKFSKLLPAPELIKTYSKILIFLTHVPKLGYDYSL